MNLRPMPTMRFSLADTNVRIAERSSATILRPSLVTKFDSSSNVVLVIQKTTDDTPTI